MPAPKEPNNSTGTTIQRGPTVPFLVREGAPDPTEMRRLLATGQYAITPGEYAQNR
jgi:hypothetical protein